MTAEECVAAIRAFGYEAEVDEAGLPTFLLTEKQYKKGWRRYNRMIRSLGWNRSWGMREVKIDPVRRYQTASKETWI